METEIPAILRARETIRPERFTFHSSRMRMKKVTKAELAMMDAESHRCAAELADARVDIMGYACLVAIMSMGHGYHRSSEHTLKRIVEAEGASADVVTSAGALLAGLQAIGARRVSVVMPYLRPLADLVLSYLEAEGIEVVDHIALEIGDNLEVGARDPMLLIEDASRLRTTASMPLCCLPACKCRPLRSRWLKSRSACRSSPQRLHNLNMLKCLGLEAIAQRWCFAFRQIFVTTV